MASEASSSDKTHSFEMTWGSSTSSGYCSEEDSDSEFEQYFTARTSFFPKSRKPNVTDNVKKVRWQEKVKRNSNASYKFVWKEEVRAGQGWVG